VSRKDERRARRLQQHDQEVASRAEDLELLAKKGLEPYVSDDGRVFTVSHEKPGELRRVLAQNSHIEALIAELQDEARSESGQSVLRDAYKLFRGIQDMREDIQ
jgi:hypothetical protein